MNETQEQKDARAARMRSQALAGAGTPFVVLCYRDGDLRQVFFVSDLAAAQERIARWLAKRDARVEIGM